MTVFDPVEERRSAHLRDLERRATRALSLTLPAATAWSIVRAAFETGDINDKLDLCRSIVSPAITQHRIRRFKRLFRRTGPRTSAPAPLGPESGIPSKEAIALSLYLGVPLDRDELADILGTSPSDASRRLYRARCAALGVSTACRSAPGELLGTYADGSLDLDERLHLREHLRGCEQCRELLSRFEALDAELIRALAILKDDPDDADAPDSPTLTSVGQWGTAMSVGLIGVLCLAVVGLLFGVEGVLGDTPEPVPLLEPTEDNGLDGWLLSSTVDGLAAMNLETGERKLLLRTIRDNARPPSIMVSPSGEKVALWYFQEFQRVQSTIEIATLGGEPLQTWRWDVSTSPGRLSGWLNDGELLFVRAPGQTQGETTEEYLDRQTRENQLLVLDVETREERTIFTGSIVLAIPSPDREFIALLGVYNRYGDDAPGRTIEIRPYEDGQLGEPVVSEEYRYPLDSSRPVWSADSSTLYYTRVTDESMDINAAEGEAARVDIAAAGIDGNVDIIIEDSGADQTRLLGVSPDKRTVLYLRSFSGLGPDQWELWRATKDDGQRESIATSIAFPFYFTSTAIWLPDGETAIVNDSQAHYLNEETSSNSVKAASTRFLVIDGSGSVETVVTELGLWGVDAWGEPTMRWFPDEYLDSDDADEAGTITGSFSDPEPMNNDGGDKHTNGMSSVSPDGTFSLVHQTSVDAPVIWTSDMRTSRLLAGGPPPTDVSWASGSTALVGVQDEGAGTKLTLYAARSTRVADFFDYRAADPVGIVQDHNRAYRWPRFSANGNQLAYFVVDEERNAVNLWLSSVALGHREVLSWSVPDDAVVDPPLVSLWTSNETLVVAVPEEWRDGYPAQATLTEVSIGTEGSRTIRVRDLHTLSADGRARGVTLESIELDPDLEWVGMRMRSYESRDPDEDTRDSILVAPASDVTDPISVARGGPGDGLSWSPDGEWLSFPLDGRLAVARHDGRDFTYLTSADASSRFPLWLPDGNLYYTEGSDAAPQLMRIRVR